MTQAAGEAEAKSEKPRRRARGEQTRARIIEATLDQIAEHGVGSVTHRAVARRADVQLSLTTYYFKDLAGLLSESFEHFAARGRPELESLWGEIFQRLDDFRAEELADPAIRSSIARMLGDAASNYVGVQLSERSRGLAVEQAFFAHSRLNPEIRDCANAHLEALAAPLVQLFRRLDSADPQDDATLMLGTLMRLEYEALGGLGGRDEATITTLVLRQFEALMGLPRGTAENTTE